MKTYTIIATKSGHNQMYKVGQQFHQTVLKAESAADARKKAQESLRAEGLNFLLKEIVAERL